MLNLYSPHSQKNHHQLFWFISKWGNKRDYKEEKKGKLYKYKYKFKFYLKKIMYLPEITMVGLHS